MKLPLLDLVPEGHLLQVKTPEEFSKLAYHHLQVDKGITPLGPIITIPYIQWRGPDYQNTSNENIYWNPRLGYGIDSLQQFNSDDFINTNKVIRFEDVWPKLNESTRFDNWYRISILTPPEGTEIQLFSKDWIHEDFCPTGVKIGYFHQGLQCFILAHYDWDSEDYEAIRLQEDIDFPRPTHWSEIRESPNFEFDK